MFAQRKLRMFLFAGLALMLVGGLAVSSADAGCGYSYGGFHGHHVTHYHAAPTLITTPYVYPVTIYDCYGYPQIIYKTGYSSSYLVP